MREFSESECHGLNLGTYLYRMCYICFALAIAALPLIRHHREWHVRLYPEDIAYPRHNFRAATLLPQHFSGFQIGQSPFPSSPARADDLLTR